MVVIALAITFRAETFWGQHSTGGLARKRVRERPYDAPKSGNRSSAGDDVRHSLAASVPDLTAVSSCLRARYPMRDADPKCRECYDSPCGMGAAVSQEAAFRLYRARRANGLVSHSGCWRTFCFRATGAPQQTFIQVTEPPSLDRLAPTLNGGFACTSTIAREGKASYGREQRRLLAEAAEMVDRLRYQ